jgi:hypothetical protein
VENQWLAIVLILVVVVVGAFVATVVAGQRRVKAMREVAARLGYEYHETLTGLTDTLAGFALLSQGGFYSHKASNLLSGKADGVALTLFDDSWITGHGKNQRAHNQTVLLLSSERLNLPEFVLRPEGFFAKIQGAMGGQDIDFGDQPAFSKAYVLKGIDEAQLRALFSEEKRTFFAGRTGLTVEGRGRGLLCYRAEKRVSPKGVQSFVEGGLAVVRLFEVQADTGSIQT